MQNVGDTSEDANPDVLQVVNNRGRGHPLNPGVRFGYLSSKGYFMKNVGSVKDYRTARQLLLDAESAMMKTIESERWRNRQHLERMAKERDEAIELRIQQGHMVDQVLREKEV